MASSSSSSTKTSWMYDAFLSFRGGDTRNNFTDHLYMALTRAGARTFRDSEELRKGEDISPALIGAIQGSRISLVVFSENYAGSSWCLDELLHIVECQKTQKQKVLPIFYHVDASDVRHQNGSFGKAFEKHEARETQDKLSGWRSALNHAAELAGWDLSGDRSEAEFIKDVVDEISRKLNNTYLQVAVYPVGIDSLVEDISNSLCAGVDDDVRMVGIWGMGGSGKTSVVKAVYNKFYHSFENKSFLANVGETAKESNGKITLQERLLSDILKPTKIEVGNVPRGINVIKERLGSKKVLVIVDDVDDEHQLIALAMRHDSFVPGSRIIVTTRDQHLLELLEVDSIHRTLLMNKKEALELFSWHAFHNPCPDSEFLELTRRAVTYCGGLPLALEVLGSALFKGSKRDWESTLDKLKKLPHGKIQNTLRISFDALDENQKNLFVNVSRFFIGMDKNYVIKILEGRGLSAAEDISVLIQRCLVVVSEKNKLTMHSLLRNMFSKSEMASSYDVFLSFRGVDTRNNFTSHLYGKLVASGIHSFIDDNELRRGEDISTELIRAIKESRISLIVFSANYASSSWCLDELVKIMECRKTLGQAVFPIFYDVDPSDVRHQTGSFAEAFVKHKATSRYAEKVSGWIAALHEAANLSGFHLAERGEAEFIDDIVNQISRRLTNTYLHVADYPVGIDSRVEEISKSLCVGVDDKVHMVGIWGMGGMGKTSVAKAIYNKFYRSFEGTSFLANVGETAKQSNGKITLQETLLSDILRPTKIEVGNADRGIILIKERLGNKKVLVIVDDVDDVDQLTALGIRRDSFGPGSKIVVTTRDRHLLERLGVDTTHLIGEMNEAEALELFSWHAFQNNCPVAEFLELSRSVVNYCGRLPLALEVLGSSLFGRKDITHWKCTLEKLEKIPHGKIQKKLRISFDALDENQKNLFLDVSCFFIGMDKNYVIKILESCGLSATIDIIVLIQRCLVVVSEKNKLTMHNLLRDTGREVVREEYPEDPEKCSRLWRQEDVVDILTEESGTKKIKGLALNLQGSQKKSFTTKAFRKMKKLKLLQLNCVELIGDYDHLSKHLRWLCWHGFSLKFIGNDFLNQGNLVSMDLQYSNLVQVWEHPRVLEKLMILNLSHSHYLTQSPDFSKLPNLEYLIMKDCKRLSEMHQSIGDVERLALVNLKDCIMLKDLPKSFYKLKSVKTLVLSGCSRFQNFSDDIENMTSLTTLLVSGSAISRVPSCLGRLNLNYSSLQDLILVKHRFPEVPRNHLNMGSSSVHSLSKRPCFNNCTDFPASGDLPTRSKDLESDHCTALAIIPNSSKASRQSSLQRWTANGEGGLLSNDCISLGDLSNSNYYTSLPLNRDLPTSLKESEADHYTNALEIVPNFSKTSRQSILQEWPASGDGGICLPANDFPGLFTHVRETDHVFFQVPQIIGCNIKALTVRVFCSLCFSEEMSPSRNSIFVTNHTKRSCFVVRPAYATAIITSHEVVIWQGNLSNNQLNLEGGDCVMVEVVTGSGLRVKKTGVSLVWDPNLIMENMTECERVPYEDLASDADNVAGPSHDSSDGDRTLKRSKIVIFSLFCFVAVLLQMSTDKRRSSERAEREGRN